MFTKCDMKILTAVTLMNSLVGDIYAQTGIFTLIEFTKYYHISEAFASNIVISVHICTGLTGEYSLFYLVVIPSLLLFEITVF